MALHVDSTRVLELNKKARRGGLARAIVQNALGKTQVEDLATFATYLPKTFNTVVGPMPELADQKHSGTCWIFATINVLRFHMIQHYGLEKSFALSHAYLQFYHFLESCNALAEIVYDMRDRKKLDRSSLEFAYMLDSYVNDGGSWTEACALMSKYGIVPKEVYPSNLQARNSADMLSVLHQCCYKHCHAMMARPSRERAKLKKRFLKDVHAVLVAFLGVPPAAFSWSARDAQEAIVEVKNMTPKEYYETRVLPACDPEQYVVLKSDPRHPFADTKNAVVAHVQQYGNKVLGQNAETAVEYDPECRSWNVSMKALKSAVARSVRSKCPVYFASDVMQAMVPSLMALNESAISTDRILGLDTVPRSRAEAFDSRAVKSTHAMVFAGLHEEEGQGKIARWLVQNSWSAISEFVMSDAWFDNYVMIAAVPQSSVDPELLDRIRRDPKSRFVKIPAWDVFGVAQSI